MRHPYRFTHGKRKKRTPETEKNRMVGRFVRNDDIRVIKPFNSYIANGARKEFIAEVFGEPHFIKPRTGSWNWMLVVDNYLPCHLVWLNRRVDQFGFSSTIFRFPHDITGMVKWSILWEMGCIVDYDPVSEERYKHWMKEFHAERKRR